MDKLENREFIGFIGLGEQDFEADFLPCIDIGWRIKKCEWNKGYASEGAKACLEFAFATLKVSRIISLAPLVNTRSEQVMRKIGMRKVKTFIHPKLINDSRLNKCILYQIP